jgi:curved DNA-binding protein CbpA
MPTLYDILGVPEDASADEVRHAYYRSARRLHPDVNHDVDTSEDMRRLNQAWTVLGHPAARRAYDLELHPVLPEPEPFKLEPVYHDAAFVERRGRFVRPSVLMLAVLLVIFVVTAYAGPRSKDRTGVPQATVPSVPGQSATSVPSAPSVASSGSPGGDHLGQCLKILPGYDAVVPCTSANDGQVVAEVGESVECPDGTHPYQLAGMVQIVCLDQAGR